jgi:hypothetical protein
MFQTDAGRIACTRPYSAATWPLVITRQRLPRLGLSTLNSMAFGLAVYASQRRLPDDHAKLASSCWSSSTGRDSHPQGSDERFQSCNLHLILLSQAFLAQVMHPRSLMNRSQSHRCGHVSRFGAARGPCAVLNWLDSHSAFLTTSLSARSRAGVGGPKHRNCSEGVS